MAPTHTLTLRNGQNTDDLRFHMEVNGVIETNGSGEITDTVADGKKSYDFRGTITAFTVVRGAGSCVITNEDGATESFRFQDLVGYDTRNGVSGTSNDGSNDSSESSTDDSTSKDDSSTNDGSNDGSSTDDSTSDETIVAPKQNSFEHTLVVKGGGNERNDYHFSVSGPLQHSSALDGTVQNSDVIDHSFAAGITTGGVDAYTFDGELLSLDVGGSDATVLLDGSEISPNDYPDNFMTIQNDGGPDAGYSFVADNLSGVSVTNGLFNPPSDVVRGGSSRKRATGSVGTGVDVYVHDGALNWVYANTDTLGHINGEKVTPQGPTVPTGVADLQTKVQENRGLIQGLKDRVSNLGDSGGARTFSNKIPELGCVPRQYSTNGTVTMTVGDGREYESLQSAFNDIPHHVNHNIDIEVYGRTKDQNAAHIHSVTVANHACITVIGHDNAVINNGGINIGVDVKLDHFWVENITFEWVSQCKDARFQNCTFEGNGFAAFSGKMGGKMLVNCTVGSDSDTYGISSIGNEMIEIRNCTLNGNRAAVKGTGVSMHAFVGNNTINAPQKYRGYADEVWCSGKRLD